uniref:Uncharacterized protein n=1 Tax=Anguilla anguilla TaxID=7936 RepID=A0A0E9UK96_ANGAN
MFPTVYKNTLILYTHTCHKMYSYKTPRIYSPCLCGSTVY